MQCPVDKPIHLGGVAVQCETPHKLPEREVVRVPQLAVHLFSKYDLFPGLLLGEFLLCFGGHPYPLDPFLADFGALAKGQLVMLNVVLDELGLGVAGLAQSMGLAVEVGLVDYGFEGAAVLADGPAASLAHVLPDE